MKRWSFQGVMGTLETVNKFLSHRREFVSTIAKRIQFGTFYQMLVPWERVSHLVKLLLDLAQVNLG